MATELEGERPVSFFYHLGDIVYLHGERANYGAQFFEPYAGVSRRRSSAVAGNHDGELAPGSEVGRSRRSSSSSARRRLRATPDPSAASASTSRTCTGRSSTTG